MTPRTRSRPARLALVALVLLATCLTPSAAYGQPAGLDLVVEQLDATLRPGGALVVRGRVDNAGGQPADGLAVVVTLERRTLTRLQLQETLDGDAVRRAAVASVTVPVPAVAPGGSAPLEIVVPADQLGLGAVEDPAAGVYPLRLELTAGGQPAGEVRTAAVALPEQVGTPVRTSLLVALEADLGYTASDVVDGDPLAGELSDPEGLAGLVAALAGGPEVPLTVATSGAVLSAAADAADGYRSRDAAGAVVVTPDAPEAQRARALLADLRSLLDRDAVEHIALPYASADLVALVRAGQEEAARQAVGDGVLVAAQLTDVRPAPGVLWPPAGLDPATLDALAAGLDVVVTDTGNLEGPPEAPTLTPPPVHQMPTPSGSLVTLLVGDPWLSPLLGGQAGTPDGGPPGPWPGEQDAVVAAQRVLAESAAVYFEAPFAPEPRGLLIAPPQTWDPRPDAVAALLEGIARAPWLQPVTLPGLAADVPAAGTVGLAYDDEARSRELDVDYLARVEAARDEVAALATVIPGEDDPVDAERLVRMAASVHYRGDRQDDGLALIEAVESAAGRVFDGVRVVQGPQFSLTGSAGTPVPIEVRNDGPVPVEVQVRLSSPRFAFEPESLETVVGAQESEIVRFEVRTLTPGATQRIVVEVTDLSGERVLATGQVVVASRTSSVAAILVTVGAGLFLGVWWLHDAGKRRRQRQETQGEAAAKDIVNV